MSYYPGERRYPDARLQLGGREDFSTFTTPDNNYYDRGSDYMSSYSKNYDYNYGQEPSRGNGYDQYYDPHHGVGGGSYNNGPQPKIHPRDVDTERLRRRYSDEVGKAVKSPLITGAKAKTHPLLEELYLPIENELIANFPMSTIDYDVGRMYDELPFLAAHILIGKVLLTGGLVEAAAERFPKEVSRINELTARYLSVIKHNADGAYNQAGGGYDNADSWHPGNASRNRGYHDDYYSRGRSGDYGHRSYGLNQEQGVSQDDLDGVFNYVNSGSTGRKSGAGRRRPLDHDLIQKYAEEEMAEYLAEQRRVKEAESQLAEQEQRKAAAQQPQRTQQPQQQTQTQPVKKHPIPVSTSPNARPAAKPKYNIVQPPEPKLPETTETKEWKGGGKAKIGYDVYGDMGLSYNAPPCDPTATDIPNDEPLPIYKDPAIMLKSSDPAFDKYMIDAAIERGEAARIREAAKRDEELARKNAVFPEIEPFHFNHSDLSDLTEEEEDLVSIEALIREEQKKVPNIAKEYPGHAFHEPVMADPDGVVEDADDLFFDPRDDKHTIMDVLYFGLRTLLQPETTQGWKLYEPTDGSFDFDRDVCTWPRAYLRNQQSKFRFISPEGKLVEVVKDKYPAGTVLNIDDHIAEDLVVTPLKCGKTVDEILNKEIRRLNIAANRKPQHVDPKNPTDEKVATADVKAYDSKVYPTLTNAIGDCLKQKITAERKNVIEGFNEVRLDPLYFGESAEEKLKSLLNKVTNQNSFANYVRNVGELLESYPKAFSELYRARVTSWVNNWVRNSLCFRWHMDDLFSDWSDVYNRLEKDLGEIEATTKLHVAYREFHRYARGLVRMSTEYSEGLPAELCCPEVVVFTTNIATITLPIDSELEGGILPEEGESFSAISHTDLPTIHTLLDGYFLASKEAFNNMGAVIRILTQDGQTWYAGRGVFATDHEDCIVISKRNWIMEQISK